MNAPVNTKKKFDIKLVIIPVVAVVLVVAIVIGVVVAFSANKPVAAFNALKKTVFESSSLDATVYIEDEKVCSADLDFGEGINDSVLDVTIEDRKIAIDNGNLKVNGQDLGDIDTIVERMQQMGVASYGIETSDLNLIDVLDTLINGKLDEKEFAEFYDNEVVPTFEKSLKESNDISIELPTYDQTMDMIERFLKKYLTDDALVLEKAKSKEKGTTYEYKIYVDEMAACLGKFAKEDEEARALLETLLKEADSPYESVDEMVDDLVDEYSEVDEKINGEVTIASGRITRVVVERYGEELEIEISSKK
ncbi:MAG: hypothetical protein J6L62_03060 [Clostridia bacterium]|nr:hypothetical protein [Clostridia bacterium]